MSKLPLLMIGSLPPGAQAQAEQQFQVHKLPREDDEVNRLLEDIGGDIQMMAVGLDLPKSGLIERMPALKVIAKFGVGYDAVDLVSAVKHGIIVTNTPDILTEEVADTAVGLLIMTVRELPAAERWLRAGRWSSEGEYPLTVGSLRDRSVGIVGLGRIGKAIAKRCEGLGLSISYYGRNQQAAVTYPYYGDLVALADGVDTLIVATPGGAATQNLINADVLRALGPRGVLINVARGTVVDEPALIKALKARSIHSAGLDVFWNEPQMSEAFLDLDNVVLLPHVGSASILTREGMGQLVVDNLLACRDGKEPLSPVAETPFSSW